MAERRPSFDELHWFDQKFIRAVARSNGKTVEQARDDIESTPGWKPFEAASTPSPQLLDTTYEDLIADRDQLDRVVRAVMLDADVDYIEALDKLDRWFKEARRFKAASGSDEARTLRDAIEASPLEVRQVRDDLNELERQEQHIQESACDDATPAPEGELREDGYVQLASTDDGARLLTDEYQIERAYLLACDIGAANSTDEGREEFVAELRQYVRAGIDYPASLQLQKRDREIEERTREESAKLGAWQRQEREDRAKRREVEAEFQDAHDRLRRSL